MTEGAARIRLVTYAGAVDSLGLAVGWTVFNLLAVYRHGLAVTGLLNAAMLCGVALSAPLAAWFTTHFSGRHTLQFTALIEGVLRAATLALLFANLPVPALTVLVLVMNTVAWTGYAAMRAEVSAAGGGESAMTRYVAVIIAAEAIGTSMAALLPIDAHGGIGTGVISAVIAVYAASLLPTFVVAVGSPITRRSSLLRKPLGAADRRTLLAGAALMVVCSGPTLLFIGLTARLLGHAAVAGAAIAFALGSVLAPATGRLMRRDIGAQRAMWPLWGAGMIIGWAAAPWSVFGLWLAQFLSGVCLAGLEGAMDNQLARSAEDGRATTALANGSAARALGGAAAVRLVPMFSASAALSVFAGASALACLVVAGTAKLGERAGGVAQTAKSGA